MVNAHRDSLDEALEPHGNTQLQEFLDHDKVVLDRISKSLHDLQMLYRGRDDDAIVRVRELPERIEWLCEVCGFPGSVDFTGLRTAEGWVLFGLCWDAFVFSVQGALLAIRRDRAPGAHILFEVRQDSLMMTLDLTHESVPEQTPLAWSILELLIHSVDGAVSINTEKDRTTVCWTLPLVT